VREVGGGGRKKKKRFVYDFPMFVANQLEVGNEMKFPNFASYELNGLGGEF
jgi:hypothetical protein